MPVFWSEAYDPPSPFTTGPGFSQSECATSNLPSNLIGSIKRLIVNDNSYNRDVLFTNDKYVIRWLFSTEDRKLGCLEKDDSMQAHLFLKWHYLYTMFISTVYIIIFITPNQSFENITNDLIRC